MVGQLTPARCVAAAALRARGADAPPGVCRRVPSAALEGPGACTGRVPVLDDAHRPRSKWAPFGCVHSCLTAASRRSFRQRHPPPFSETPPTSPSSPVPDARPAPPQRRLVQCLAAFVSARLGVRPHHQGHIARVRLSHLLVPPPGPVPEISPREMTCTNETLLCCLHTPRLVVPVLRTSGLQCPPVRIFN